MTGEIVVSRAAVEEVPAASVQSAVSGKRFADEPFDRCLDRCIGRVELFLHLN